MQALVDKKKVIITETSKHKSKKSKKRIIEAPQLSGSTHDVADEHVTTTSNDLLLSDEASMGDQEDASKQDRMIDDLDADKGVALLDESQGRNYQNMFDTMSTIFVRSVVTDLVVGPDQEDGTDLVYGDGEPDLVSLATGPDLNKEPDLEVFMAPI
nr:hypothetical protein [Tanacetum cinerariifolium]